MLTAVRSRLGSLRYKAFLRAQALAQADAIETHLTPQEKWRLYELARRVRGGTAVEIGSFVGASACFIAQGIGPSGRVVCIDTWQNDAMSEGRRDTLATFLANTRSYASRITRVQGYSHDVVDDVRRQVPHIDLLFIDGEHSYEGCKRDWDLYAPLVRSGGIVAFHDVEWAEGVQRVIREADPALAKCERLPNLLWGQKR